MDCEEHNYLGLEIYWNYSKEYIDISMQDYVRKALDRLQHTNPKKNNMPHNPGQYLPTKKNPNGNRYRR